MSGIREYLERRRDDTRKEMEPLEATAADLRAKLAATDAKLRSFSKEINDIEKALQALGKKEK
jgi:uncharacterized coiled-coil DUF342 family protein